MIGLVIILILALAFYEGARRGTILQLVYILGFFISYLVAKNFYQLIGEKIELYVPYLSISPDTEMALYSQELSFDLGKAYYAGVAFLGLIFVGWLLTKFIGILATNLRFMSLFPNDWILSGVLNVGIMYTFLFMVLLLLSMIPINFIQSQFEQGSLLTAIVEKTPILSETFHSLWITDIIH